jgi:hypothetical protein
VSITRKWPIARAEWIDDDGTSWIAEARAGTGVWVICEHGDYDADSGTQPLRGLMVEFPDQEGSLMLVMAPAQRESLEMDDRTYHELNVALQRDYEDLKRRKRKDRQP